VKRDTDISTQIRLMLFVSLCVAVAAGGFALSVAINAPSANDKLDIWNGGLGISVQGTVSIPEHPSKVSEATIIWSLYFGGKYYTTTTKSGDIGWLVITTFPASNACFGLNTIYAGVNSQQFYGTGSFFGAGALDVIVLVEGENYEGYIVNNSDSSEQDMVVAEDTSTLPGCPYLIKGFCTDAHKGIPGTQRVMGVPWTSTSSADWAYWVRQAVVYGDQHSQSDNDILEAIWYISDRSGFSNDIVQNIGYPANGPTKNEISYDYISDTEGWSFVQVSPFTPPVSSTSIGSLQLTAQNNTDTFGYWKSPDNGASPMYQGSFYRTQFLLHGDVTDKAQTPQVRLRVNAMNARQGDTYTITSVGAGDCSPDTYYYSYYSLLYAPSSSVWNQNAVISFDLLNFDPTDDATGAVQLGGVDIQRFEDSNYTFVPTRTYEFDTSAEGWQFSGTVTPFAAPESNAAFSGSLDLTALTNTNTFGFWRSNTADITATAYTLYKAQFLVHCDQTDANRAPVVRLRAFSANNQISQSFERPAAVQPLYGDYTLYFVAPQCIDGQGLGLAFDILDFDPSAAAPATLSLDRVQVSSYPSFYY
jgi:hypothetical protein